MERSRQRGHSFYADDDEDVANVASDGVNSLSVSLDDIEYENGGEETEEPRGRSQSLTEDDDPFGDVDEMTMMKRSSQREVGLALEHI